MDFYQKIKEKRVENSKFGDGCINLAGKERQPEKPPVSSSSPPSASSSPSHEFSFSVSFQTSSTISLDKAKVPAPFTVDLSPADDIFFHGHLLPLHLLSHLSVPPRCSTNSMDSYALPIRDLLSDKEPEKENRNCVNCKSNELYQNNSDTRERSKSKSFSLLGIRLTRWRKGFEVGEQENKVKLKRKLGFNLSHVLKRYARMVRPLLHFRGRREDMQHRRQPYSFSGNLSLRNKQELRGRKGGFSAPVSMRTSPTNSGVLLATATLPSNDSTMEELQTAIQAAIAHCKNSVLHMKGEEYVKVTLQFLCQSCGHGYGLKLTNNHPSLDRPMPLSCQLCSRLFIFLNHYKPDENQKNFGQ